MRTIRRCRILGALLLMILLSAVALPSRAFAQTYDDLWSDEGVRAESFSQIDESARTINISTPEELGLLAYEVNVNRKTYEGYTVTLTADIDLDGHAWDPIGYGRGSAASEAMPNSFKGAFDGAGFTIRNMGITDPMAAGTSRIGLFGSVAQTSVRDLTLVDCSIDVVKEGTAPVNVGILAGASFATAFDHCTILDSSIDISVPDADSMSVGGLVGAMYDDSHGGHGSATGVIVRDVVFATEHGQQNPFTSACGGLVGYSNEAYLTYSNCYAASLAYETTGATECAGLIGSANVAVLHYCFYQGDEPLYYRTVPEYETEETSCSKVAEDGTLVDPVTIDGVEFVDLKDAMNAWNASNGMSDVEYTCKELGVGHDWNLTGHDGDAHTFTCGDCHATLTEAHMGGEPTCSALALCTVCRASYGALDPDHHASMTYVAEVPATADKTGARAHYVCGDCGALFLDEVGTRQVSVEDLTIPVLGGGTEGPSYGGDADVRDPGGVDDVPRADQAGGLPATADGSLTSCVLTALFGVIALVIGFRMSARA